MPDSHNRVAIDRIDWASVFPVLRLASAFRHALQPGKLMVALIAVLAIHFSGTVLDWMFYGLDRPGVYSEILGMYAAGAVGLMHASLELNFAFDEMNSVPNILGRMVFGMPAMIFQEHPWFTLLFGADVLCVLALASGIMTRLCATQVCTHTATPLASAIMFVGKRWAWYLLTPLMPTVLIGALGGVLVLAGLIFFNVPGLDIVGALGFGVMLVLGFVIAVVALLLLLALFLMPPALSVEGSDGFDAISRAFNYILFRPWQFALYLIASVLYLAVVYLLVSTVASLTIAAAGYFVEVGSIAGDRRSRFEQIARGDEGGTIGISAWIVARWIELVAAIFAAILFSTLCCLATQVYVLMRRSADGTPLDQISADEQGDLWADEPGGAASPGPDSSAAGG